MTPTSNRSTDHRHRLVALLIVLTSAAPALAGPAQIDLCGCAGSPASLGDFRSFVENTYPPGTMRSGSLITIPLPPDGRLIFDSFTLDGVPGSPTSGVTVRFSANAANDPVRLLVAGDVTIPSTSNLDLSGSASVGSAVDPRGGLGGPGGFRGGDGGLEQTTLSRTGGYGLGPGGGAPGVANSADLTGRGGTFVGNNELFPLIGGGGGGGGSSTTPDCSGGGGGGGGGAILIAANGTLTLAGSITSAGAAGAGPSCSAVIAGFGGTASAGAIHLIADAIVGSGSLNAQTYQPGIIRLEAFDISPTISSNPVATRSFAPGPPTAAPSLAITSVNGESESRVNGEPLAERPQGVFGGVDVIVSGGVPVVVQLASSGLVGGTQVEVSAKRRTGGQRVTTTATLANCNGQGECSATATLADIPAGSYFLEAKATFQ